jgi:hypothetical protein
MNYHAVTQFYAVLVRISPGYSPLTGRLHTCYSPVRRSPPKYCYLYAAPRLACVRPVASVHPEPGSNSSLYLFFYLLGCYLSFIYCRKLTWYKKFDILISNFSLLSITQINLTLLSLAKNFPSLYYIICCSCILKDRCSTIHNY